MGRIGAGSAIGAIIGGVLGGVKGAVLGVLIGGGGTIAATEGKDVTLPPGTILRVRLDNPARHSMRRPASGYVDTAFIAFLATLMVLSTSFSLCAAERNQASNCEGGGYTPPSSMARKNRPYATVSAVSAD